MVSGYVVFMLLPSKYQRWTNTAPALSNCLVLACMLSVLSKAAGAWFAEKRNLIVNIIVIVTHALTKQHLHNRGPTLCEKTHLHVM